MRLADWEATIRTIVDECNQEAHDLAKNKTLMKWRARLEQEPTLLEAYQIDEIIREARRRLGQLGR
jgi:hypothetical protein